jgi:hypothetical protein
MVFHSLIDADLAHQVAFESPLASLQRSELTNALECAIDLLTFRERLAVCSKHRARGAPPVKALAQQWDCSRQAVYSAAKKAEKRLGDHLKNLGFDNANG